MPLRRLGAEAVLDPSEELRSERDLGQQEQHLLAGGKGRGHGLEIDFGLA